VENFLTPVLALIIWTFVMWFWMLGVRVPEMNKMVDDAQEFIKNPALKEKLSNKTKWSADNYNHLHEQPVVFYALMFYLHLSNITPDWMLYLAWGYVISRVIHSLVQATSNRLMLRFGVFCIGSFMLMAMAAGGVMAAI